MTPPEGEPVLEVREARPDEVEACLELRRRVFVDEQGVEPALENDGRDGSCLHLVARLEGQVVGTARLRPLSVETAKVERFAVDAPYRGAGIGSRLLQAVEVRARTAGFEVAVLHAQRAATAFYSRAGYAAEGEPFVEAEIPHQRMRKVLSSAPNSNGDDPSTLC